MNIEHVAFSDFDGIAVRTGKTLSGWQLISRDEIREKLDDLIFDAYTFDTTAGWFMCVDNYGNIYKELGKTRYSGKDIELYRFKAPRFIDLDEYTADEAVDMIAQDIDTDELDRITDEIINRFKASA